MSKRKWVAAKLFAVLGGAGLAIGICVPRAIAQLPTFEFSNANYLNRYTCNETSGKFTGQMVLHVNGAGTYVSGTLEAPLSAFTTITPISVAPAANFCSYTLDVSGSSYLVSEDGIGVEVLSWTAASTNSSCPASGGTFIMSDTFVMRTNGLKPSGAVVRTEITSNNFLNQGQTTVDPGYGHCLK